jgi:hypothetical protein
MSIVTLALAKAHMNIDSTADDELIQLYIDAAEAWLSAYIGKPLSYDPDWRNHYGDDGEPIPPPADYNPMPADLKLAVLKLAAFHYEAREAVGFGVTMQVAPYSVTSIADSYRERWFGEDEVPADG